MSKVPVEEIKKKKEYLQSIAWNNQRPLPLRVFSKGQFVQVKWNNQWQKAKIVDSTANRCIASLETKEVVTIYDNRCIKS